MKLFLLLILSLSFPAFPYPMTPDPSETPGELCTDSDSDFYEYRYKEEIAYCKRNVSSQLKANIYDEYEIPKDERRDYTIDHFIPLSIGGSNHQVNLWPEHKE